MSRTLGAAFITEKDRAWARPFISVVFHFGGSVGDVYVSDRDITIGGNAHKGILSQTGEYRAAVDPRDGSFQSSSLTVEIINFPVFGSPLKRFTDLWAGIGVEGIEADIYQNFRQVGSSTILQELLFAAVVRPIEYDPNVCRLELVSVSEKYLGRKEISFPIERSILPQSDPEDIGKPANQIYGSVKLARAQAVVAGTTSPLRAAMTTGSTEVPVYDEFYDTLPAAGNVWIGDEKIAYAAKSGAAGSRVLTSLTRAASGSLLQSHAVNDLVIHMPATLLYLAAGHPMKSISAVYVRRGSQIIPLDPAEYSLTLSLPIAGGHTVALVHIQTPTLLNKMNLSRALGRKIYKQGAQGGDLLVTFNTTVTFNVDFISQRRPKLAGKFVYTVAWAIQAGLPTTQVTKLWIDLGAGHSQIILHETNSSGTVIHDKDKTFTFTDDHFHSATGGQPFTINLSGFNGMTPMVASFTIQVEYESVADIGETDARDYKQYSSPLEQVGNGTLTVVFDPQERMKLEGRFLYSWRSILVNAQAHTHVQLLRGGHANISLFQYDSSGRLIHLPPAGFLDDHFHSGSTGNSFQFQVSNAAANTRLDISELLVGYLIPDTLASLGDGQFLTGAEKLARITCARLVLGDEVLFDGEGYQDDGSGTWTGTPNALIQEPAHVLRHLAEGVGSVPSIRIDLASFVAAAVDTPVSYKFAGVVTERSANLKEILLALGMQCRIKVDWPVDKLTAKFLKTSYPAISKTLTQEHVMADSRRTTLRITRSPLDDIINVVNLYYGRDWSVSRSQSAFLQVAKAEDATSITKYGRREQANRFLFDFVAEDNATMANDLRDFYLARYKDPARTVSFDCKLDQFELLPGDVIGLNFVSAIGIGFTPWPRPIVFSDYKFNEGLVTEFFDGLTGAQKFLVEEVRHRAGSARDRRGTRMGLILREVT